MTTLGDLLQKNSSDPRARLELGTEILNYLNNGLVETDQTILTDFMDLITLWLGASNFKVALLALEILDRGVDSFGYALLPHVMDNFSCLLERLGDNKENVRQEAMSLILKLMNLPGSSPQYIVEKLGPGLSHKQWQVRVSVLTMVQHTVRRFGAASSQYMKIVPLVCKLTTDPTSQVRDTAADTLVELYIHLGEKVTQEIQKKKLLSDSKSAAIFARFDDAKRAGLVGGHSSALPDFTVPDCAGRGREPASASKPKITPSTAALSNSASKRASSVPAVKRIQTSNRSAGAVDEDQFCSAYTDVPKAQFFSTKELSVMLQTVREVLSDVNADWDKRVDALKRVRSLLIAGAKDYDEFYAELKVLEVPFQMAIKDLRSQVVREACLTIAYLSENLGPRLDRFTEQVLPNLIAVIQNSAKVMATSGFVTCRIIIKNTHSPKLVPIIAGEMNSKSKEIRKACSDFVAQILLTWEVNILERCISTLQEAVKQGLFDADQDARASSRRAYSVLSEKFKEHADALFQSLDASRQRQLTTMLNKSSSNQNIAGAVRMGPDTISRLPTGFSVPVASPGRSTSDIDAGAARRALQRHAMTARTAGRSHMPPAAPVGSHNGSLPRPFRPGYGTLSATSGTASGGSQTDGHFARTPNKSISQPGSRSTSPSSRIPSSYSARKSALKKPVIPTRSNGGSRDASPSRVASAHKYLGQPKDLELALDQLAQRQRRVSRGQDDLDSETSSICSERSTMRNGDSWDIRDALVQVASTQWTERKEGLQALQSVFRSQRSLTHAEVKRVCDVFSRLFVDHHNKTFSLFLDTLVEFLAGHRTELSDWLYVLLVRLLTKLGTDLLASVQTKLQKTLEVVRESFPYHQQFNVLIRYIIDPVQTPTLKVKVAVLSYISDLAHSMDASIFNNTNENRQAMAKIVQWSTEQKSLDVRKASQNVLVALFSLNAPEFTLMLATFPKQMQDIVYQLLQSNLKKGVDSFDRSRGSPRLSLGGSMDLEEVRNSLRQTSAEIQNYSFSSVEMPLGSQDSGIVDSVDSYNLRVDGTIGSGIQGLNLAAASSEDAQEEAIAEILTELSNHNRRSQQRKYAMTTLKYMTRDGSFSLWDQHFKTVLLILLETLGDEDAEIRSLALRVLKEICLCQSGRFLDYIELTTLRLLDAQKDKDKDVVRAAEDCASVLALHLPPLTTLRMLIPIIQAQASGSIPTLLAAIKVATKVVEQMSQDELLRILPDFAPGIVKGYEHEDSGVRKASVVCLVGLHKILGDVPLEPYLIKLCGSKIKLLNLYIQRAQTQSTPPSR